MKFYIFLPNVDFYRYAYKDIADLNLGKLIFNIADNRSFLFRRFHDLIRLLQFNLLIRIVGQSIYPDLPQIDKIGQNCVFVFSARLIEASYCYNYILFLKEKYPKAKFVCYYQDIISSFKDHLHPDRISQLFDALISYNRQDAIRYNIQYFPTSFSKSNTHFEKENDLYDVYFLGKAKDRGSIILNYAKELISKGMSCDFNILNMPADQQETILGVNYIDSPFTYKENISHIRNARSVLEIMQGGANGYTFRTWESIAFNKVLLTNNEYIVEENEFYDENFTIILNNQLDEDDIKKIKLSSGAIHKCKNKISPSFFIDYLLKQFQPNL